MSLITHHLKYPNFLNPTHLAHIFSFSSLTLFYFLWDPYLSNWSETFISLPASPSFPTIFFTAHFILLPPQSQCQSATKEVQTTKTLNNLALPKAAHHPKFKTPFILIYDTPPNQQKKKKPRKIATPISHTNHKPNKTHVSILSN